MVEGVAVVVEVVVREGAPPVPAAPAATSPFAFEALRFWQNE